MTITEPLGLFRKHRVHWLRPRGVTHPEAAEALGAKAAEAEGVKAEVAPEGAQEGAQEELED